MDAAGPPAATGFGAVSLDTVLAGALRDSEASVGAVYLLPPGEPVLRLAVLSGVSRQTAVPWTRVALTDHTPVADAVRERRLVWVGGQEEMARTYPRLALMLPYPFALAAAPVTDGTSTPGGLVLQWPGTHPPHPSPRERAAIDTACRDLLALLRSAEEQGRPLAAPREPRILPPPRPRAAWPAEAQSAVDFAERLPGGCCTLDLDGRILFATTEAGRLLGADVTELLGACLWKVLPWLDEPVVEDHYRAATISGQPASFTASPPAGPCLSFHLYPGSSGVSVRIVPAALPTDPARVLRPAPPAEPGRAAVLYHLMHLAATLTEAIGVRDVADQAADQLLPAFGAQALALMTAEDGRLRIIGHRGYPSELMERFDAAPLTSDTPAVRAMTTGVPGFFPTFAELRRAYPPAVHQDGMGSWAFLPLITSGRPVGSLVLAYERPRPFTDEERTVLTSAAGLIAQALDRARLYDAKHRLAQRLQEGLLPRTLPCVPGLDVAARYLPAGRGMGIGGDFYDLIRLGTHLAGAAIGDVQGHNVSAAALMGQVRTAVHATAGAPPDEVLARTNRLLTDLDPGLFTSCLYVQLDLAHHRARLATAGHLPPLLRHPDGHVEVLDLAPGLLLGIDPHATYPPTEIPLPPGALLALYTDGLVETPGADIEDGIAALAGRLARAGTGTVDEVADALVHHAEQSPARSDDIALLLIQARREGG
ncbi:SpoIIE family protein phosphatase [Actinacidiphila glaucinigra]|uniref:protein-serine/threonine phosphatase n=1 Tax=Actinacidiphila glaucinigra TaxID=235986 RepID=A0A239DS89_9ACTN|nr:SpoIIE family protein phosphatase [Actinacidiphila glaucinigra]SNS34434.1 Serine phosphatase RsbU, regulator of sigma subunit [Actinacidiphila glaucinigra]